MTRFMLVSMEKSVKNALMYLSKINDYRSKTYTSD